MPWTTEIITTERLTLRCPTETDRSVIARILIDPAVREFLGGPVPDHVLSSFHARPIGEQPGLFVARLNESGESIGTVAIEDERDDRELSYQLLPEFWGTGIAFEACSALLQWFWANTDAGSIVAVTQSVNARSLRLLSRLQFVFDCEFEEYGNLQTQMRRHRHPTSGAIKS